MNLDHARTEAQKNANRSRITMVVGWQINDATGANEYGYCPESAVGPAFVHTVTETIEPAHIEMDNDCASRKS